MIGSKLPLNPYLFYKSYLCYFCTLLAVNSNNEVVSSVQIYPLETGEHYPCIEIGNFLLRSKDCVLEARDALAGGGSKTIGMELKMAGLINKQTNKQNT